MKLFSKHIFLVACVATLFTNIQNTTAQDQRYSQYYSAPARISPALAGVFDGAFRLGINYRAQWGANMHRGYNSASFTADGKAAVFKDDFIGFGFNAMYDRSGMGAYSITDIGFDINYQKKLYQGRGSIGKQYTHFLIAGAHVGIGQRTVNYDKLRYSNQWDSEYTDSYYDYYNPIMASGEEMDNFRQNRLYPDFHAGLMWYGTFGNRRNAYAGGSIQHLNRPDISLFARPVQDTSGNSFGVPVEKIPMRFVVHGGGEVLVGGRGSALSLIPGVVAMFQKPSTEINFGLSIKYQQPKYDDFALRLGVWNRLVTNVGQTISVVRPSDDPATWTVATGSRPSFGTDALIFIVGLDFNNFQFGFSYDATLSTLRSQNNTRGSFEFSAIYIFRGDAKRRQGCPTF